MPLSTWQLRAVKCANDPGDYTPLVLRMGAGPAADAVPLMRRAGGMLLATLPAAVPADLLARGNEGGAQLIGPNTVVQADWGPSDGESREAPILLVDLGKGLTNILGLPSVASEEEEGLSWPYEGAFPKGQVLDMALEWVGEVQGARAGGYVTAEEEPPLAGGLPTLPALTGPGPRAADGAPPAGPPPPPGPGAEGPALDRILNALAGVQAEVVRSGKRVDELAGRVLALENDGARTPIGPVAQDPEALEAARAIVGAAPQTRAARGAASSGPARPDPTRAVAEDDSVFAGEEGELSELKEAVKVLLAGQMAALRAQPAKRKKKVVGIDDWEDEASEESDEKGRELQGARGAAAGTRQRAAMRRHAKSYAERIERNMMTALDLEETEPLMARR